MRTAINGVCIQDDKILLVKKKDTWILPGGKPEENESDIDCLIRENKEELPEIKIVVGEYYGNFTGITPFSNTLLTAKVFFMTITGNINTGAEISQACFFENKELSSIKISEITEKIISKLKKDGHF